MSYTMRTRAPSKLSIVQYPIDNMDHDAQEEDSRDEEHFHDSELSDVESTSSDPLREEQERLRAHVGPVARSPTVRYLGGYATQQAQVSMNLHDEESIEDYPELSDGESIDSDTIKQEQERLQAPMRTLVRTPTARILHGYAAHDAPYSMTPPSRLPRRPRPRPRRSSIHSIGTVGSGMTNFDPSDVAYRQGFPGMRHITDESETGKYASYNASDWFQVHRPTAEEWRSYGISMLAEFRATGKLRDPMPEKPVKPVKPLTPPPSPVVSTSEALVKVMATSESNAVEIQKLVEKTKRVENVERKKTNTPKWERKWKVKEAKARSCALRIAARKATGSSTSKGLINFGELRAVGFIFDPALKTQLELAKASKCIDYRALKAYEEKLYGWPDRVIKTRKVFEIVEEPEELMTKSDDSDDDEVYQVAPAAAPPKVKVKRDFLGIRKGFKKAGHAVKEFFTHATSALHRPWARKGAEGKRKEKVVGTKRQAFKRFFSGAALTSINGCEAKKGNTLKGLFSATNDDGAKEGEAFKRILSSTSFSTAKFELRKDVVLKGKDENVKVSSEAVNVYFSAGAAQAPSESSPYGTDNFDSRKTSTTSFKGSIIARLRGRTTIRNFSQGKVPSGSYTFTPDFDFRNLSSASIVYNPNPSFVNTPVNADTFGSSHTVHRIPPAQTTAVDDIIKTANLESTTPMNITASAEAATSDADMEAIARLAARKLAKLARLRAAKKRNQVEEKAQEERRKADGEKCKAEEQMQAKKRAEQEKRNVEEERRKAGEGTHKAQEERLKKPAAKERLDAEDEKRKADEQRCQVDEERINAKKENQAKIARFKARRKTELKHQRHPEAKRRKANEEKPKAIAELVERRKAEPDYLRKAQSDNQGRTKAGPDLFDVLKTATRKANEQKRKAEEERQAKVAAELGDKRKAEEGRLAELFAKAKLKAAEQRRTAELEQQRRIEADRVANDLLKTNKVEEIAPWETQASVAARMVLNPHDIDEQDWEDVDDEEEEKADTVVTPRKENNQTKSTSFSIGNPTSNNPSTQTGERTPRQSDFNQTTGTNTIQTSEPISLVISNDSNTPQDVETSTINATTMPSSSTGQPANITIHTSTEGFMVWADGCRLPATEILTVTGETMARSRARAEEVDSYREATENGTLRVGTFGELVNRPLPTSGSAHGNTPTSDSADGTTPTSANANGNNAPVQTTAAGTRTTGAHPLPPLLGMPSTEVPSNPMSARHLKFLEEIRKRQEERDVEWARLQKEIDEMHETAAKALESSPAARVRREEQCEAARAIDDAVEELRMRREQRKAANASAAAGAGSEGEEVEALKSPCGGRVRREEQRRGEIDEMVKKARKEWEAREAYTSRSGGGG